MLVVVAARVLRSTGAEVGKLRGELQGQWKQRDSNGSPVSHYAGQCHVTPGSVMSRRTEYRVAGLSHVTPDDVTLRWTVLCHVGQRHVNKRGVGTGAISVLRGLPSSSVK